MLWNCASFWNVPQHLQPIHLTMLCVLSGVFFSCPSEQEAICVVSNWMSQDLWVCLWRRILFLARTEAPHRSSLLPLVSAPLVCLSILHLFFNLSLYSLTVPVMTVCFSEPARWFMHQWIHSNHAFPVPFATEWWVCLFQMKLFNTCY